MNAAYETGKPKICFHAEMFARVKILIGMNLQRNSAKRAAINIAKTEPNVVKRENGTYVCLWRALRKV